MRVHKSTHTHTHLCVNSASQDRGVEQVFWSPHLTTILSLQQTWDLAASKHRGLVDNFLNSFPRPSPQTEHLPCESLDGKNPDGTSQVETGKQRRGSLAQPDSSCTHGLKSFSLSRPGSTTVHCMTSAGLRAPLWRIHKNTNGSMCSATYITRQ